MTIRWKLGKRPTTAEIKTVLSNASIRPIHLADLTAMAEAVLKFMDDRIEGRT